MPKDKDVSYTDYGRSGVTYTDEEGNPISKEKMYEADEREDAPVESILEKSTRDMIKRSTGGSMSCPNRPDGVRGGGAAIAGMKFTGVK